MENEEYLEEVRKGFERDDIEGRRIGQVWKRLGVGRTPVEIADELGGQPNWVYSYKRYISAIEEGGLPSAPSPARQCGRALRGFSRRHEDILSEDARSRMQDLANECDRIAGDPQRQATEDQELRERTRDAESRRTSGIYVYSLPHYLKYPLEPSEDDDIDDRTCLKVGRSDTDVHDRVATQARATAVPEDPILLRIYRPRDSVEEELKPVEDKIHDHLIAAGHKRSRQAGGRREWFVTSLRFLDSTADLIDLDIAFDYESQTLET